MGPTAWEALRPNLLSVSLVNADEAWAGGFGGTLLHYHGGAWQPVSSPLTADVAGLQMLSAQEGYAAGGTYGGSGMLARWDGTTWTQIANPAIH